MVMQAYIDDSGSSPTDPIFVMAGFVAPASNWSAFSDDWQEALDRSPGLAYFKMKEAAHFSGEFRKDRGWDETTRNGIVSELARIIVKHAILKIHVSLRNGDFDKHLKQLPFPKRTRASDNPYWLLSHSLMAMMATASSTCG